MAVKLKRAYEPPAATDGCRILVDRLWPRGVTKAKAKIDEWRRELAPSKELRTWFGHDPKKWTEFRRRYLVELKSHRDALDELKRRARREKLTLVFGAKDPEHNNAVVLEGLLSAGPRQVSSA